jgi:hypothetical protein
MLAFELFPPCVQPHMDEIERAAIRDEGYDPDDPAVIAALDPGARRGGGIQLGCSSSVRAWSIWS